MCTFLCERNMVLFALLFIFHFLNAQYTSWCVSNSLLGNMTTHITLAPCSLLQTVYGLVAVKNNYEEKTPIGVISYLTLFDQVRERPHTHTHTLRIGLCYDLFDLDLDTHYYTQVIILYPYEP